MKNQTRIFGYDVLRTIAIFMVVVIHAGVQSLSVNQGGVSWFIVLAITSVCGVAVPLFFMLSGALLLDVQEPIGVRELFQKRIAKQIIPFFIWSFVYIAARIVFGKLPLSIWSVLSIFREPAYGQFWFMYTLFALYLLLPVLQVVALKLTKKQMEYLFVLWIVFSLVIPIYVSFININYKTLETYQHLEMFSNSGYTGYFLLGYYLKKHFRNNVNKKKAIVILALTLAVLIVAVITEWWIYSKIDRVYYGYFTLYTTPAIALEAGIIFVLLKDIKLSDKAAAVFRETSKLSVGVFYVHMLVLTVAERYFLVSKTGLLFFFIKIVLTYSVSLAIAFVISRIPIANKCLLGIATSGKKEAK